MAYTHAPMGVRRCARGCAWVCARVYAGMREGAYACTRRYAQVYVCTRMGTGGCVRARAVCMYPLTYKKD